MGPRHTSQTDPEVLFTFGGEVATKGQLILKDASQHSTISPPIQLSSVAWDHFWARLHPQKHTLTMPKLFDDLLIKSRCKLPAQPVGPSHEKAPSEVETHQLAMRRRQYHVFLFSKVPGIWKILVIGRCGTSMV